MRRELMIKQNTKPPVNIKWYAYTPTTNSNKITLDVSFTPDIIIVYDKYRFANANWETNGTCPHSIYDAAHGSLSASASSNTASSMQRNVASLNGKTYSNGLSYKYFRTGHTIGVFAATTASLSSADNVYFADVTPSSAGTSIAVNCPFTPDFIVVYDTTVMDNNDRAKSKTYTRMYDNVSLGQYNSTTGSSNTTISCTGASISTSHAGQTVSFNTIAGHTYRVICYKAEVAQ